MTDLLMVLGFLFITVDVLTIAFNKNVKCKLGAGWCHALKLVTGKKEMTNINRELVLTYLRLLLESAATTRTSLEAILKNIST